MGTGGIRGLGRTRRGSVALTVVGGAEVGTALEHFHLRCTFRMRATGFARARMGWLEHGGGPLPDIANHVVQAISVRRKRTHG